MRKRLYVNKEIQRPLMVILTLFWIVSVLILGVVFFIAFYTALGTVDIGPYARMHLSTVYKHAIVLYVILGFLLIIAGILLLLKISNKIAGPLSRLQKVLDEQDKETLKNFELRKGDYLNSFVKSLKNFFNRDE